MSYSASICTYPWVLSHTHTHTLAGLCSGSSAAARPFSWPLAVSPWAATQIPSLSPPSPPSSSLLLSSSEPISWQCTHTVLSTNCLSISPVPANYQLLMNGSPYWVERRRGEGEERRRGKSWPQGETDCYYVNKLTTPLWCSACVYVDGYRRTHA